MKNLSQMEELLSGYSAAALMKRENAVSYDLLTELADMGCMALTVNWDLN